MSVFKLKSLEENQMKKSLLALFAFFLSVQIFAQSNIRIGQHATENYNPGWSVPVQNFSSVEEGRQIIQNILSAVGRSANFEIRSVSNIQNAAAVAYGGKRYVLYNPNFINALDRRTGNQWASISVLAHEVGHHLKGHTTSGQSSHPAIELEADEFSGYALRKMGASLEDAQATMKLIASETGSASHPGKSNRLSAIEDGWETADEQMGGTDVAVTRPPIRQQPTRPVQTREETRQYPTRTGRTTAGSSVLETVISILGQVLLKPDQNRNSGNYVTDGLHVMRMINNNWHTVGKLARTNNSKYPFAIYDHGNSRLFVDRTGNILNINGQYLGLLKAIRG
jgi:hypothetical protein